MKMDDNATKIQKSIELQTNVGELNEIATEQKQLIQYISCIYITYAWKC